MKKKKTTQNGRGVLGISKSKITSISRKNNRTSPISPPCMVVQSKSGILYQKHNNLLNTPEQSFILSPNNCGTSLENSAKLQYHYNLPSPTSSALMGENTSYNINQGLTTIQPSSNQSSHKEYNSQQGFIQQTTESQHYASNSVCQFPRIVSALLGEFPNSIGAFGNSECATDEALAGAIAPSNAYWKKDEARPCTPQTQYQLSSSDSVANVCYETNKSALDINMNMQAISSCQLQQQIEHHMSAFASGSAEPLRDQDVSQFPEIQIMEQLCQAALGNGRNQHSVSTEEPKVYSGITTQLSLLDLDNPLEELVQNAIQNNADVQSGSNMLWNPSHSNIHGEAEAGGISASLYPPRFCQL
jgi:hypothetical protein